MSRLRASWPALSCAILALLCSLAPRLILVPRARASASGQRHAAGPRVSCLIPGVTAAAPAILAPANNLAVSTTVVLAVAMPNDTTASVDVCAAYRPMPGAPVQMGLVAVLGNGTGSWSSSWNVAALPSQSDVTLSFIAAYPTGGPALLGQRTIVIDHAAPSSTLVILGPDQYTTSGGTTYLAAGTPISLSASDPLLDDGSAGSGAIIYDQIDGGQIQPFSQPFAFGALADGMHIVTYWAVDRAGNAEIPHTQQLTLDTQPPAVTPLVTGSFNTDGSANAPVTVAFTATDAGSGVRGISYAIEPGFAQSYTAGRQIVVAATGRLDYSAADNVGNAFEGTLAITVATATATSVAAPPPTGTATPSSTAIPTGTPLATHTPRPQPTWPPIDGPPILDRLAARLLPSPTPTPSSHAGAPATAPHLHVLPARRFTRCGHARGCRSTRRRAAHGKARSQHRPLTRYESDE